MEAAANHTKPYIPFRGKACIAAPSTSNSQKMDEGIDWVVQSFAACAGKCPIDFCNPYWYSSSGDDGAREFLGYVADVHEACEGKPIRIADFKADNTLKSDVEFLKYVIHPLDKSSTYAFVVSLSLLP